MCPLCIATAAWIVAGATSTGGVSALAVSRLRSKNQILISKNRKEGDRHEAEQRDPAEHEHTSDRVA